MVNSFHFDAIAHDNDAKEKHVLTVDVPPPVAKGEDKKSKDETPPPILLHGSQKVAKFNREVADEIQILLALYRIESKSIDLVFSANVPTKAQDGLVIKMEDFEELKRSFNRAARSLHIVDFGLFA